MLIAMQKISLYATDVINTILIAPFTVNLDDPIRHPLNTPTQNRR